jgi:hypothetical protein
VEEGGSEEEVEEGEQREGVVGGEGQRRVGVGREDKTRRIKLILLPSERPSRRLGGSQYCRQLGLHWRSVRAARDKEKKIREIKPSKLEAESSVEGGKIGVGVATCSAGNPENFDFTSSPPFWSGSELK